MRRGLLVVMLLTAVEAIAHQPSHPILQDSEPPPKARKVGELPALAAQVKTLGELSQRLTHLEKQIESLELREQQMASLVSMTQSKPDLSELARFDCTPEGNKATTLALVDGKPVLTYMGGGAMNCTQRLATAVRKAFESLDRQR